MALPQASPPPPESPPAPALADRRGDAFNTVTQLARDLGITARTIRFYEDKGLITPQRAGSTRVYTARDRGRMILILRGKRLGFSLRNIKDYLDLYDADQSQAGQIRVLLGGVQTRLDMLKDQRRALETTIDELEDIQRQATEALALKLRDQT
jgi:DNA-binding transcriptional MerR regulator